MPDFKRNSRECIMEAANGCEIETSGHGLAPHASSPRRRTSHGCNTARAHAEIVRAQRPCSTARFLGQPVCAPRIPFVRNELAVKLQHGIMNQRGSSQYRNAPNPRINRRGLS